MKETVKISWWEAVAPLAGLLATLFAILFICAGCVCTYFRVPGGPRGVRVSLLYPFTLDDFRMVTSNTTFEITGYKTEGANSNTVALSSAFVEGVSEGVVNALIKKGIIKETPK